MYMMRIKLGSSTEVKNSLKHLSNSPGDVFQIITHTVTHESTD